jgi:hypothetical protein
MNTEKLEKLKKSLDNKFIPDNMKEKIRAEIQKLETDIKKDESITATEVKEEVKEIEQKVEQALEVAEQKEEKLEAKKPTRVKRTTAPKSKAKTVRKTTTAKKTKSTSSTSKKSIYTIAKEIRKPNETWKDAVKRAGANMRGESKEVSKKVSSELEKLKAFVKRRKELKGMSETNLVSDSKRKGLPPGKRVSPDGNVYYEYRDSMSDRLAPNYPKNAPYLAGGGGVDNEYDAIAYAKTKGKESVNWDKEVREYAGSQYSKLTAREKEEIIADMQNNWDSSHSYAGGGGVELNDVKVKAYKGFHGLQAENYFENVNGYDWNVVTMKRYGGDLVSSARGGKSNKSDGYEMFTFDWDSPSIKLVSSRPSRVTEKVIEEQHKLALQTFKDKMESGNFADGGYNEGIEEDIDLTDDNQLKINEGVQPKNRASMKDWMGKTNESREAMAYELGGATMQYDLAGNTGGGTAGLNADMPLSGVSGTQYTDLVGETGALSSGEMFDGGGRVKNEELISYETFLITEKNDYDKAIDSLIVQINKSLSKKGMPPITTKVEFDKESEYQERVYVDDNVMIRIWSIKKTPKGYNLDVSVFKEHFAKGGMFKGGGNLSRDRKYVNYREDYEVRYAKGKNRHGYGNLKFAGGGAVMANQQIIDDASQQYVNYYLGEGASAGMFADGGAIKNQYKGRSPMNIWNNLTREQKSHFLHDHQEEIAEVKNFRKLTKDEISQGYSSDWIGLDDDFKNAFAEHISKGQYAIGGMMPKVSKRKHRNE